MISEFRIFRQYQVWLKIEICVTVPEIDGPFVVSDVRLMTSRELIFNCVFGHVIVVTWPCCIFVPNLVQL